MRTLRAAAIVAVTSMALIACSNGDAPPTASPTPSPVATPSATPTPSPSPSPSFDPMPPVANLTVTTQGLLPLTIGQPPATNLGAAMITFDPTYCEMDDDLGLSEGDPGRWISTYPGGHFSVDADDSAVHRIDIWDSSLTTPEGIGIGSTLADLQAAYPSLQAGVNGVTSYVWWIADSDGFLVFETQNHADWSAPSASTDAVILMRVLAASWGDPDWGAANSGNVAGACF